MLGARLPRPFPHRHEGFATVSPKLLRAVFSALYRVRLMRLRRRPRPADAPEVRSGDPVADRVLVLGNGLAQGWDVGSHHLGPIGHLSRVVAGRTGRGCDVDLVGSEAMNMASALAWLGSRDLAETDAVVVSVGANDVLRLTPSAEWGSALAGLIADLRSRLRPHVPVLVAGVPSLLTLPALDGFVARFTAPHRAKLNTVARRVAEAHGAVYVDLESLTDPAGRQLPPADAYAAFGRRLAEEVAPLLTATRPFPESRDYDEPVWEWSGLGAVLDAARRGELSRLSRLSQAARVRFGVEVAAVALADGDRVYHATGTDILPRSVPTDLAMCRVTIEAENPVVVSDVRHDPRFAHNPLVDVARLRFYAGYPLHGRDGGVIGTFSLFSSRPRLATSVSIETLRRFALQAEAELHRFEAQPLAAA